MFGRIEAGERSGGDPHFQRIAVAPFLADRPQHAWADGSGVFTRSIDPELLGDWLVQPTSAARGKEDEIVAESSGAMDVVRIAGVDPDVQPVAILDSIVATPRKLPLAGDFERKREARFVPTGADLGTFRPAIGNKFGGLSGPGIKPIIVRMVYQCAKAVKIPVIGCGGIVKVEDAVEYMLAGASAVMIGYLIFRNPSGLIAILDGLEQWCAKRGFARVADLTGAMIDEAPMETFAAAAAPIG